MIIWQLVNDRHHRAVEDTTGRILATVMCADVSYNEWFTHIKNPSSDVGSYITAAQARTAVEQAIVGLS